MKSNIFVDYYEEKFIFLAVGRVSRWICMSLRAGAHTGVAIPFGDGTPLRHGIFRATFPEGRGKVFCPELQTLKRWVKGGSRPSPTDQ